MKPLASDYDSPWKEGFEHHLLRLLELLFLDVVEDINWKEDYESLEQELRKMAPSGETGKRLADKLIKVRTHDGDERILHVEVQGQPQQEFEYRVYVYQYRDHDRFGLPPDCLVILADDNPKWRPTKYEVRLKRTALTFEFRPVKLLDWRGREDELRNHPNSMGLFVLAHLEARRTAGDDPERARVKLDLYKRLTDRKLDGEEWYHWYKYLDWFLPLPEALETQVFEEATKYAEEKKMPFVTFAERYAEEKGQRKGLAAGRREKIELLLRFKFGEAGLALYPGFSTIDDPERLQAIAQGVEQANTLDDVRKLLPDAPPAGNGAAS